MITPRASGHFFESRFFQPNNHKIPVSARIPFLLESMFPHYRSERSVQRNRLALQPILCKSRKKFIRKCSAQPFLPATPNQIVGVCCWAHAVVGQLLWVAREQKGIGNLSFGGLCGRRNVPEVQRQFSADGDSKTTTNRSSEVGRQTTYSCEIFLAATYTSVSH